MCAAHCVIVHLYLTERVAQIMVFYNFNEIDSYDSYLLYLSVAFILPLSFTSSFLTYTIDIVCLYYFQYGTLGLRK